MEDNQPKTLSEFYRDKGGDCDEFMLYVTARLLQFGADCGFTATNSSSGPNHIAAVYRLKTKEYVVVDPPLSKKLNCHLLIFTPSKYLKIVASDENVKFSAYRVWWFSKDLEDQSQPQKIQSGE